MSLSPTPSLRTASASARPHPVLDPRSLGRPVHRLDTFTRRLQADLDEVFILGLNRRYRAGFVLRNVRIDRTAAVEAVGVAPVPATPQPRWQSLVSEVGRIGFSIDRPLLMTVLNYRYGLHEGSNDGRSADEPLAPETTTEARLSTMLALQWANTLALCIDTLQGTLDGQAVHEFTPVAGAPALGEGSWTVTATVSETVLGVSGQVRFRLDEAWMARLLRQLAPARERATPTAAPQAPLPGRLSLTLQARLLEQELPLGTLLDLHVGDVLPVRLGLADVLVDDARLFKAAVAEHQGKLCLTSFQDAE